MEGTMMPRDAAVGTAVGFRAIPGGGALAAGRPRYLPLALAIGVVFVLLGLIALFGANTAASANPGGGAGLQVFGGVLAGVGLVILGVGGLQSGGWLLSADDGGVQLSRAYRAPRRLPWADVARVRCGATAIRLGRAVRLGDALRVDGQGSRIPISVDTVHFRVSADELDRMAAVVRDLAARHGVPVEPFPTAGRERP